MSTFLEAQGSYFMFALSRDTYLLCVVMLLDSFSSCSIASMSNGGRDASFVTLYRQWHAQWQQC